MKYLDLVIKYDIPGPRYTSYPPVPYWEVAPKEYEWIKHIKDAKGGVDLYIHIPFCKRICHYCGCNRVKLCDSADLDKYVSYLLKEWEIYKAKCGDIKINSIHLGGGTPSILSIKQIDKVLGTVLNNVNRSILKGSVEIDPRTTSKLQLEKFYEYGIRRVSFGIQDFDQSVQEKIGRIQPFEDVRKIIKDSRNIGFNEINFDLIFGLPGQSLKNVAETFEKVIQIMPDTIAYYSFAYVPNFAKNQENIDESDLLTGINKWNLLARGREILFKAGYKEVGMDHYALEDSSLNLALQKGELQRNFMGYVNHKTETVLGLGPSSISSTKQSFIQNSKELKDYFSMIDQNLIPYVKGHMKSSKDLETEEIIHNIMCRQKINLDSLDRSKLDSFIKDDLIKVDKNIAYITDKGKSFLRNICMKFDERLGNKNKKVQFSRTI